MDGFRATNGSTVSDIDHLRQSVREILTTPIGSRVMRRDFGSRLPELVDQAMNGETRLDLYVATVEALARWEPRLEIESISAEADAGGRVRLDIVARYLPDGRELTIEGLEMTAQGASRDANEQAPTVTAPTPPRAPSVLMLSATSVRVAWDAVTETGGSPITSYVLRYSTDGGSTWEVASGVTSPRSIIGLNAGDEVTAQVRAVNAVGAGAWSPAGTGRTDDVLIGWIISGGAIAQSPTPPTAPVVLSGQIAG